MTTTFDAQHIVGLSEACVVQRIRDEGYNELPSSGRRTVLAIAFDVVRETLGNDYSASVPSDSVSYKGPVFWPSCWPSSGALAA